MVHVVNKGKEGERDVVKLINMVLYRVSADPSMEGTDFGPLFALAQRNQNQSAVGGGDINFLGISFEVKRQETLAVPEWWRQCTASAARNGDHPLLLYRQNRKPWRAVTLGYVQTCPEGAQQMQARVELDQAGFESWLFAWIKRAVQTGRIDTRL